MAKKSIRDLEVRGRRVLCRVDFNVPLDSAGHVTDSLRIRAALPTIEHLLKGGARLILMSHLGRPKGGPAPEFSLRPVQRELAKLLGQPVVFSADCIGTEAEAAAHALKDGEVLLLENLRFHAGEEKNAPDFVTALARLGELYVNDAFGTAHRAHASTEGVARALGNATGGFLMEKELRFLNDELADPTRPLVAVLGGAKVSGKIDVIENLIAKVDSIVVGGGMMFTFYKAMGLDIGSSLLEEDRVQMARDLMERCRAAGVELLLPVDVLVADRFAPDAGTQVVDRERIPAGWIGVDIGPRSIEAIRALLGKANTVVWNGPMGVFEMEPFSHGTLAVARALVQRTAAGAITIVGGGDSAAAVAAAGLEDGFSHVSTGGGASLELLEGKLLPGVEALDEA
ncbi:MAG: phosphoglycerate kinase [Calditrichaeota bacterium]|nr:phosphoglycerate kinase [Calditrichota bacterium]